MKNKDDSKNSKSVITKYCKHFSNEIITNNFNTDREPFIIAIKAIAQIDRFWTK